MRLDVWPGPLDVAFSEPLAMEELVAFSEGPAKAWEGWVDSVVEKLEDDGAKALAEGARPEQDLVCWSEVCPPLPLTPSLACLLGSEGSVARTLPCESGHE